MIRSLCILMCLSLIACGTGGDPKPRCDARSMPVTYGDADQYCYDAYYTLEDATACAKSTGRSILIMFTGYNSMAVRGLEWDILCNEEVKDIMDRNYILVVLYCDDKTASPKDSTQTVGQYNSQLQADLFQSNSSPMYACVNSELTLLASTRGYTKPDDPDDFIDMLNKGLPEK